MMRVFFLHYAHEAGLRPDAGGFRKLWELARATRRLGHDAVVFHPRTQPPLVDVPARAYPVIGMRAVRPLSAWLAMAAIARHEGRRRRPDIVYYRHGLNVLPLAVARRLGARPVLEVNADVQEFLACEPANALRRRMFALAERINVRHAHHVVAVTGGLADALVRRHRVVEARVDVIPSGTDTDHFRPDETSVVRRRLGLAPDRPTIGFVGLFYRHQGVSTLLDALAAVRQSVPNVSGLLVGDGVMRHEWQARVRALGLADVVRFTGQVPYSAVPGWIAAMDIVVAPFVRTRGETSPFKVLDAMACGRPVVASALPSIEPLAASGGLVTVPPDDPARLSETLIELIVDDARREKLGAAGREFVVREHDWRRIAARLLETLGACP
jgi:glycosyltransferase involved in cell wall biosynthesis